MMSEQILTPPTKITGRIKVLCALIMQYHEQLKMSLNYANMITPVSSYNSAHSSQGRM